MVREAGMEPTFVHMANTGAVISRRETWNTMVRPGVALYGYYLPFQRAGREVSGGTLRLPVKPILTWKTRILSLRDFGPNQALGYGGTYVTKAPAHVAVLPVGYADGYNRQLSNRGRVIVREHYAPIVGRISMDLTLVDVTGIPGIAVGDEVDSAGSGRRPQRGCSGARGAGEQHSVRDSLQYFKAGSATVRELDGEALSDEGLRSITKDFVHCLSFSILEYLCK